MSLDMNPEIRAQWCAALRSGDYPQTDEALYREHEKQGHPAGYCCLGVLTALWLKAGHDEMVPDELADNPETSQPVSVWENPEGILSRPVWEWAGLTDGDPGLQPGFHGNAVYLNDSGYTFAEIADLIDGGTS
jgi:hypothetical protein